MLAMKELEIEFKIKLPPCRVNIKALKFKNHE